MAVPCWLEGILRHYDVPYEVHHHRPVHSASHLAHAEHVTGDRVAKSVFMSAFGRPLTVVLPASRRLDPASVRAVAGGEPRLATEAEIADWFPNCAPGCVPPLRLRPDQSILMDRSLAHLGEIVFPACTPAESIQMRFRDWFGVVRPGVGRFAQEPAEEPAAPPTVLVVEDEPETNSLLCKLLERAGYRCKGATEGGQAIEMAHAEHPSAILLDLMLPDMSGFEVCERLRQNSLRNTPIVILTALDDEASRERGWKLGADAYLVKPVSPDTLRAELSGALADARA